MMHLKVRKGSKIERKRYEKHLQIRQGAEVILSYEVVPKVNIRSSHIIRYPISRSDVIWYNYDMIWNDCLPW